MKLCTNIDLENKANIFFYIFCIKFTWIFLSHYRCNGKKQTFDYKYSLMYLSVVGFILFDRCGSERKIKEMRIYDLKNTFSIYLFIHVSFFMFEGFPANFDLVYRYNEIWYFHSSDATMYRWRAKRIIPFFRFTYINISEYPETSISAARWLSLRIHFFFSSTDISVNDLRKFFLGQVRFKRNAEFIKTPSNWTN